MAVITVGPVGRTYTTVQAAINAAGSGDVIKLDANVTFTECLTLPNKGTLADFITITSNANPSNLPAAGNRISPSYAVYLPKIQSTGGGATCVQTAIGANHYKFQWIEFPEVPQGFNAILTIGYADTTQEFFSQEPNFVTVDQCWLHGGAICGQKRGIQTDGRNVLITNSWIDNIKSVGQDSQCIAGYNGHGPLTITNNYLSCGTEAFILGGGDPKVRTRMTVTGTPTTTSANVTCGDAGHTLSELAIGQGIGVTVGGVNQFTTITSITGTGATGTIGFVALSAPPDVPGAIKAGVVLSGLTFRNNYVRNDPAWINGVLPQVTGASAAGITTSGALSAGTHYYKVQAFNSAGYQGTTVNGALSAEVSATIGASGTITVSWAAVTGAATYRVWHGDTAGNQTKYATTSGTSYADTGAVMTVATPGGATKHAIKNLFELKACQNAQIDGNIFENQWKGSDIGWAVWLKTANQEGDATYLQSRDIVFEKNIIRHCDGFLNTNGVEVGGGLGASYYPGPMTNVTIRNNLVLDSGSGATWGEGSDQYAMNAANGVVNLTIDHNTIDHKTTGGGGGILSVDSTSPHLVNYVITNNLLRAETYHFHDSTAVGDAALTAAATSHTNSKNAIADGYAALGALNLYEALAAWKAEFVNYQVDGSGDYHLKSTSPYHLAGLDSLDIGCDVTSVLAATLDVVSGIPSGGGTPPGTPPTTVHRRHGRRRF